MLFDVCYSICWWDEMKRWVVIDNNNKKAVALPGAEVSKLWIWIWMDKGGNGRINKKKIIKKKKKSRCKIEDLKFWKCMTLNKCASAVIKCTLGD